MRLAVNNQRNAMASHDDTQANWESDRDKIARLSEENRQLLASLALAAESECGYKDRIIELEEAEYRVMFPFFWSTGEVPTDGFGGQPVSNPLEIRVIRDNGDYDDPVLTVDLRHTLLEDVADHSDYDGSLSPEGAEWAEKTAAALEGVATELRKACGSVRAASEVKDAQPD